MKITQSFFYGQGTVNLEVSEERRKEILCKFNIEDSSDSAETFDLSAMNAGQPIKDVVLLLNGFNEKKATNGNPFLNVTFSNSLGQIDAIMFDRNGSVEITVEKLKNHSVFLINGKVNEYNGKKNIMVDKVTAFEGDVDAKTLLPMATEPVEDMLVELYTYLDNLSEPHRTVSLKGLEMYWSEFSTKAAAKGHHHARVAGLLQHTLGLIRIFNHIWEKETTPYEAMFSLIEVAEKEHKMDMLENLRNGRAQKYPYLTWSNSMDHLYIMVDKMMEMKDQIINRDSVIASIFYHDIGKIFEYSNVGEKKDKFSWLFPTLTYKTESKRMPKGIDMDVLGKYMGHMVPGIILLTRVIEENQIEISLEDMVVYTHNILAHHGKMEWGTNIAPATPEAVLIHFVDFLDSRWDKANK